MHDSRLPTIVGDGKAVRNDGQKNPFAGTINTGNNVSDIFGHQPKQKSLQRRSDRLQSTAIRINARVTNRKNKRWLQLGYNRRQSEAGLDLQSDSPVRS
jgi:hypothetical protein